MTAHTDVICQPRIEPRWIDDGWSIRACSHLALMLGYVQAPRSMAILATDGHFSKWRIFIGSQAGSRRLHKTAVTSEASRKGRPIERQIPHLETGRQVP